jgi:hypothetical protein
VNLADLINTPYTASRAATALARLNDSHAPFCDGSHRQKWGTDTCVTCLVPFTAGTGSKRAALFLKQDPGQAPFAELWVSNGGGAHVIVRLDGGSAADLGDRLVAVAAWIGAHE